MSDKSIDQRLFEAFSRALGVRLTAKDVFDLVAMDDAIGTRISNAAAGETIGHACIGRHGDGETWAAFSARLKGGGT